MRAIDTHFRFRADLEYTLITTPGTLGQRAVKD